MLRAAGLALGVQAFNNHPEAANWASLADELAEESWGRRSIEDAMLYQPHWLQALILYAESRGLLENAARLLGSADRSYQFNSKTYSLKRRQLIEQTIEAAKAALDEDTFNTAWEAGKAMDINQALDYALKVCSTLPVT